MVLPRLPMTKALLGLYAPGVKGGMAAEMPIGLLTVPKLPDPDDPETLVAAKAPYQVLWPLWTNTSGPPLHDADADSEWIYQLSLYSVKGDQLEWMQDRAKRIIVGRNPDGSWLFPLEVAGMKVMERALGEDIGADPSAGEGLLSAVLRFGIKVTPDY